MATVTHALAMPDGSIPVNASVRIRLMAALTGPSEGHVLGAASIGGVSYPAIDGTGTWMANLTPNASIVPAATVYEIMETLSGQLSTVLYITVPPAGGRVENLLTTPPGALTPAAVGIETARALAAEALLIPLAQKAQPSGVATLDAGGLVPGTQIPPINALKPYVVTSDAAMLALAKNPVPIAVRTDLNPPQTFIYNGGLAGTDADWTEVQSSEGVVTVNGKSGPVAVLNAADVGADQAGAAAAAIVQMTPTKWRVGVEIPLAGDLVAYGVNQLPRVVLLPGGIVIITSGLLFTAAGRGADTPIFYLPAGTAPSVQVYNGAVYITPFGVVTLSQPIAVNGGFVFPGTSYMLT